MPISGRDCLATERRVRRSYASDEGFLRGVGKSPGRVVSFDMPESCLVLRLSQQEEHRRDGAREPVEMYPPEGAEEKSDHRTYLPPVSISKKPGARFRHWAEVPSVKSVSFWDAFV